jgi:chaperonin cofactor prefoldin
MAENIVAGLFGMTPEMYQGQQYQQDLKKGYELAQLDPGAAARAQLGASVGQLGRGFAGALGIEDPQLKLISARNAIAQQIDQNDPKSILKAAQLLAQAGDQQGAMALAQYARQAQESMAQTQQRRAAEQASLATTAKTQLSIRQEEQLRDELSKLPPDATQDQILGVVTKYGSPDKVLATLQGSADRVAQREATLLLGREKIQAKLEADLRDAKNDKEREEARIQARKDLAQLTSTLAASLKTPPAPTLTTIVNPDNPSETITVDARVYKGGGKGAEGVIGMGKPSATQEKASLLKAQMGKDIDFAITELTSVTKEGGLIDQSTGSGAGRLADIGAGFFGQATEGAIAIGKLKPIQDLVLKMIPRFEGPQSDKDTQSYKEAAGQLADPTLPTKIRKEAGRTVLRLMQSRKNQFVSPELASEGISTTQSSGGTGTAQNPIVLK